MKIRGDSNLPWEVRFKFSKATSPARYPATYISLSQGYTVNAHTPGPPPSVPTIRPEGLSGCTQLVSRCPESRHVPQLLPPLPPPFTSCAHPAGIFHADLPLTPGHSVVTTRLPWQQVQETWRVLPAQHSASGPVTQAGWLRRDLSSPSYSSLALFWISSPKCLQVLGLGSDSLLHGGCSAPGVGDAMVSCTLPAANIPPSPP